MKKAQAAMEFLMTYGWTILIVLVVIGSLAYFGVLNPIALIPETCEMNMDLICLDHRVETSDTGDKGLVKLKVQNSMGVDIQVLNVTVYSKKLATGCTNSSSAGITIPNGGSAEFIMKDEYGENKCVIPSRYKESNSKLSWDIKMEWYAKKASNLFSHVAGGELTSAIE